MVRRDSVEEATTVPQNVGVGYPRSRPNTGRRGQDTTVIKYRGVNGKKPGRHFPKRVLSIDPLIFHHSSIPKVKGRKNTEFSFSRYWVLNSGALQDNSPHVAKPLQATIKVLKWEVLPHPSHSPDLAPSDYNLFASMGHALTDQHHFTSYVDVRKWVDERFVSKGRGSTNRMEDGQNV